MPSFIFLVLLPGAFRNEVSPAALPTGKSSPCRTWDTSRPRAPLSYIKSRATERCKRVEDTLVELQIDAALPR